MNLATLPLVLLVLSAAPATPSGDTAARYRALCQPTGSTEPEQVKPEFVTDLWRLVQEHALATLDARPGLGGQEFANALEALDGTTDKEERRLKVSVLDLAGPKAARVVAVTWWSLGTFFVVAREQGGWRTAWDMWAVGREHLDRRDELGRWGFLQHGFHDGPLSPTLHPLPATRTGRARFLVSGMASPAMGGDWPHQVGVWEWTGTTLLQRFLATSTVAAEFDWALKVEGARIRVHTKEPLKTVLACGLCPDLESTWTLELTEDGVRDLGKVPVVPELAAADELLDRVRRGLDTRELAAPEVAARLKELLPADPKAFLGLFEAKVESRGKARVLHLSADELRPLDFTFEQRKGRPFATAVAPR